MNDPRNILAHARGIILEQIMALSGRGHAAPRAFRTELEAESSTQLAHRLELLTDFPTGKSGSDPAPELTTACDEPQRIQSNAHDRSARDSLQSATMQSATHQLSTLKLSTVLK